MAGRATLQFATSGKYTAEVEGYDDGEIADDTKPNSFNGWVSEETMQESPLCRPLRNGVFGYLSKTLSCLATPRLFAWTAVAPLCPARVTVQKESPTIAQALSTALQAAFLL